MHTLMHTHISHDSNAPILLHSFVHTLSQTHTVTHISLTLNQLALTSTLIPLKPTHTYTHQFINDTHTLTSSFF